MRPITHCAPYLTQAQTRRLVALLEANPRKADACLLRKLRTSLEIAADGDHRHAEMLESIRQRGPEAPRKEHEHPQIGSASWWRGA